MKRKISWFFFYLIIFITFLSFFSISWSKKTFGLINLDSLIFHLTVPLKGTESGMIIKFVKDPLLKSLVCLGISIFLINYKYTFKPFVNLKIFNFKRNNIDLFKLFNKLKIVLALLLLSFSIVVFFKEFKVIKYLKDLVTYSTFIDDNYVDPKTSQIEFTQKRNLIHIMVESLESTFADTSNGGAYEESLIPYLTKYAKEEVSFTNKSGGGFINSRATGWTIAAMLAQTSGIGFTVPISGNDYGDYYQFLPGAYSLGEILEKQGYNQTLLIGSDADFAGRKSYFEQHGNYEIKDYYYAIENGWISKDYNVWWGYEDSKLFKFAKEELINLANKEEPFNLTLLTTNTHHIGGYLEDECEIKYDEQLKNVILCSDKQIYEFVEWIKKQDFYENTTIVITGDHLSMEPTFFDNLNNYERTSFNLFINASSKIANKENRVFNSLDIYPTIVGSIGGTIKGNRLALGTNLFSDTLTLYEEYGREYVDNEFAKNSKYYKDHIMYGKDL